MRDVSRSAESTFVGAGLYVHQPVLWRCLTTVKKYFKEAHEVQAISLGQVVPEEVEEVEGNLLMNAGALQLWRGLRGTPAITFFNNANAHLGVGTDTTTELATHTDLNPGVSGSKVRKVMDSTYPLVGTADALSTDTKIKFSSTFGTSDANFAWAEWGVFNASSAGTMLNRKVQALGTKTGTATWQLQVEITLS